MKLRLVPNWVWLALLATAAGGAGWVYHQGVVAERDTARAAAATAQAESAALTSALHWRRAHAQQLLEALQQRQQALDDARDEIRYHREALEALEQSDDQVRDWAADDLPAGVADWLRRAQDDQRAGAGDPGDP